jgi:hypothetical protein
LRAMAQCSKRSSCCRGHSPKAAAEKHMATDGADAVRSPNVQAQKPVVGQFE